MLKQFGQDLTVLELVNMKCYIPGDKFGQFSASLLLYRTYLNLKTVNLIRTDNEATALSTGLGQRPQNRVQGD